MSVEEPPAAPWHREPFVWMVIAFPLIAVLAGIVTLILAIQSDDGLVVDDYYKHGLEINRLLERERAAHEQDLTMQIQFLPQAQAIKIVLSARGGMQLPDSLSGVLAHATRKGFDYPLTFRKIDGATYRAENVAPRAGPWYLDVGTADWRLVQRITTH